MLGNIHSIETFGSADGPGVRYLIFLKGCNMRCKYCHNPDTWAKTEGEMKSAEEILQQALRYKRYWGKKGGITVSGGEALLQIDFVTELFTLAKEKGVNTCLDTAGNPFTREKPFYSKFEKLMEVTDLFMLDIKEMDEDEHKQLTGQTNKNILDMATCLSDHGKAMWIRHVLVPGITDDDGQLHRLRAFIDTLKTVERVEILPYHTLGVFKWKELGIPYALEDGSRRPKSRWNMHGKSLFPVINPDCMNRRDICKKGSCKIPSNKENGTYAQKDSCEIPSNKENGTYVQKDS